MSDKLSLHDFMQVVQHTPLVSIDLLIYNEWNEILLGWRNNEPAAHCWFVPGGRILKDEPIRSAFTRIVQVETGANIEMEQAVFHGVYEHLHQNQNFAGLPGFGTHYIVLAFECKLAADSMSLPRDQHARYRWMAIGDLLQEDTVHRYVKNYFNGTQTF